MLNFKQVTDKYGKIERIEMNVIGHELLNTPKLTKGSAFTLEERIQFKLLGKLPFRTETLEEQANRTYEQYSLIGSNVEKNVYLNELHDTNETLFFKMVGDHLKEMLPILYTPTMAELVKKFSVQFRRARGLYLAYPEIDQLDMTLDNRLNPEVDLIVMTDGERILGIGDQGVNGMPIPMAKSMVYTLCAGVNPHRMLPIQLDVGTNNERLLSSSTYLGWRHERISGPAYDDFIGAVVASIQKKFPKILLHWEDFGRDNARRNLERFRNEMCTYNDDMQGTGVITLACVLAAVNAAKSTLKQQRIIMFGAGTAGTGIADQIYDAMLRQGMSSSAARACFWLVDRAGLLINNMSNIAPFQKPYLRDAAEVTDWSQDQNGQINLIETIKQVKPTILIGTSTQGGAFTQAIIQEMAKYVERPIIFPLSNPTEKAEATPANLLAWTHGKAIIATGSPFGDVDYNGRRHIITQCNNAFAYPGIGLGAMVSKPKLITDNMLWAAAKTLSEYAPSNNDPTAPLLPDINNVRTICKRIAFAVATEAINAGLAQVNITDELEKYIEGHTWVPKYYPYQLTK